MSKKIDILWIVVGAAAGAVLYLLLWWVFDCFAGRAADHLRNLIFLTGGITAAMIAAWRAQVADEQAKTESKKANVVERAQIADRFARATEQLNNDNIYMRIGAIQALKRIGYDSESDVMGVLCLLACFVRDKSPAKSKGVDIRPLDAKESLDAVGRLASHYKDFLKGDNEFRLDLSASNLTPFPLSIEGYSRNFDFSKSNIMHSFFVKHDFSGASFVGTDLTNAIFLECNCVDAQFMGAILDSAVFNGTDMSKANFFLTTCNNTILSTAKNLTTEMLKDIIYDEETRPKVPEGVDLPPPREK